MASVEEIHVGDVGTIFNLTIKDRQKNGTKTTLDVSGTTTQIVLKIPGGSKLVKSASFVTDGTDGQIQYTTVSGDITVPGNWKIQAIVTSGTNVWNSEIKSFKVNRNL